jgi:uncharacterized protein (TIGR01777 family)
MRIVVTGGTGFLGSALVARLQQDHDVVVLTRQAPHQTVQKQAERIVWSPHRREGAWTLAVQHADAVINLAGEPIAEGRWSPARKDAIRRSRVDITRAIVDAIREAPRPPALISGSAIGIYGTRDDTPLTESSPTGSDFLASVCQDWEAEAQRAAEVTRLVLLRTGLVLARNGGALAQMALPFRLFAGGPLGSGRQYWSWIHRDDWVEMVRWALANTAVTGPLNLTAPGPVTNTQFARTLGRVMRRPALVPAPAFALRLALGEMADAMILSGQRVLPQQAEALGFAFAYPDLEPALRAIYTRA